MSARAAAIRPPAAGRAIRLRRPLLRWHRTNRRDLPWRRTRDPYAVLVSEVMLQQTPVARVLPAYARFMRRFPSLGALARASLGDVLREWSGLGYPRRARDLHRIARSLRSSLRWRRPLPSLRSRGQLPRGPLPAGRLPRTVAELDALPGIGPYTAGAVACFACGDRVAFADTNVRRVLGRAVLGRIASERDAVAIDRTLLPRDAARWHHALMDLGATVCRARAPRCDVCPLALLCVARRRGALAAPLRRQAAYASSDRRVRGLILRALAAGDATVAHLRRSIGDPRVPPLTAALERDGLVERAGRRMRLPV